MLFLRSLPSRLLGALLRPLVVVLLLAVGSSALRAGELDATVTVDTRHVQGTGNEATFEALRRAVACGDVAALQRVPGIGKKGAQRLVLELGAKLGPERGGRADPGESATVSGDVVEALVGLGWSERDAAGAGAEAGGDSPEAGLPELLRASLRVLGARR